MRTLPTRGLPPRGSAQDLVAIEMVRRERTLKVAEHEYTARILQLGFNIPAKSFDVWTNILAMEVFQESYSPHTIRAQQKALASFDGKKRQETKERGQIFDRLAKLEVKSEALRIATPQEREALKMKLRKLRMQDQKKKK